MACSTPMKIGAVVVTVVIIVAIVLAVTLTGGTEEELLGETEGREYMENLNEDRGKRLNTVVLAEWEYASNITDYNEEQRLKASIESAELNKEDWRETIKYDYENFEDENLKRMFKKYSKLGTASLESDDYENLQKALSQMQTNYATVKVCDYKNQTKCDLNLEPEVTEIFETSDDPEELKYIWREWYNKAGKPAKDSFTQYVEYVNKAAKLNGFDNNADVWLAEYEQEDFEKAMDDVWHQMEPLYLQLHAYVRKQLFDKYGSNVIDREGPIPAHLLGNVWAQTWGNLEKWTTPYPEKPAFDVTEEMRKQNYTPKYMFELADEFFTSLNLTAMPPNFWNNSILEKPNDGRELICHASAWDFYDGEDFRVKQCTIVTHNQLETVHHEMGHVEYFLQYKDQPPIFKDGANPGFHEAVGDVISLSVSSPKHLQAIGLLDNVENDDETEINNLYSKGIDKIAFLPFALILDKFRYGIFRGETKPDDYNCHFWRLREEYQGIEPPMRRSTSEFDAAAKYHVSADVEYARYYVSFIIQFQFHRTLCEIAGEYNSTDVNSKLTDCDIYQNADAGNALGKILRLGSSKPWQDAMEMLTGERVMNASGILEYFKPLYTWLEAENARTGEKIGWNHSKIEYCSEELMNENEYIANLNLERGKRLNRQQHAEWNYGSNITDHNEEQRLMVALENANLNKIDWKTTIKYEWEYLEDENLKRMFKKFSRLGTAALESDDFEKLQRALSDMQTNYATVKVCDYNDKEKCDLSLEPEVTEIFETSEDSEELKHIWNEWYTKAGAPVKDNFTEYVKYVNMAAQLNGVKNNAEVWLEEYEQEDFEKAMDDVWEQMKPLYLELHAYVRNQLHEIYGPTVIDKEGPIPAHLLGNVWAQTWGNLEKRTTPYPDKPAFDVTDEMRKQNYTPKYMFELADEFFTSLNLTAMPPKFWENSILEKPDDGRELICHASAWDFYDGEDFRVKQCTIVTHNQLETVHHEMGHVEYYLQYKDQPPIYRRGANPGFHEAVGDVISLSVSSPKHLQAIGLLETDDVENDDETEINNLYSKGMDKIAFLPFALLLDKYRYAIFRGETKPEDYNCHFWKLRQDYQGIEPPLKRTENDFDAAAKYHVSADVEYARYYVSFIIQFQFHRSLCKIAGEYDPSDVNSKLTDCDIYQNTDAGNALGSMLRLGSSKPWQDAMEMLTGERVMNADGILDYFKPLYEWLKVENAKTNEKIGWNPSKVEFCTPDQLKKIARRERSKLDSLNK